MPAPVSGAESNGTTSDPAEAQRVEQATKKLVKMVMDNMGQAQANGAPQPAQPLEQCGHEVAQLIIECPNGKTVRAEAALQDQFLELQVLLSEFPESCYFTAYHLTCMGTPLNEYAVLENYDIFRKMSVVTVKMQEDFYEESSARAHVRRLRELLVSPPAHYEPSNAVYIPRHKSRSKATVKKKDREAAQAAQAQQWVQALDSAEEVAKAGVVCGLNEYHMEDAAEDIPECVRNIAFSAWNPPPGNRRLQGDLLYLEVVTLEDNTLHITASVDGFFLNNSTRHTFDPTPAPTPYKAHTLVDTIKKASPLFGQRFNQLLSRKISRHPYEILPVVAPPAEWNRPRTTHTYDWNRSEQTLLNSHSVDEWGLSKEWNSNYQESQDQPCATVQDLIKKERAVLQTYHTFVNAAIKGAEGVVQGNIAPVNPGESKKCLVYLHNNIFYSFAVDMRGQYQDVGGDETARRMAAHDLKGVSAIIEAAVPKIHTLAQCVVDYRGHRVVAQSVIPGIFHDLAAEHVYGSMDNGKCYKIAPEFHEAIRAVAKTLHISEHKIQATQLKRSSSIKPHIAPTPAPAAAASGEESKEDSKDVSAGTATTTDKDSPAAAALGGSAVPKSRCGTRMYTGDDVFSVAVSAEVKGMTGFDNRMYALDCLRMTPRDPNYPDKEDAACLLRPELIAQTSRRTAYGLLSVHLNRLAKKQQEAAEGKDGLKQEGKEEKKDKAAADVPEDPADSKTPPPSSSSAKTSPKTSAFDGAKGKAQAADATATAEPASSEDGSVTDKSKADADKPEADAKDSTDGKKKRPPLRQPVVSESRVLQLYRHYLGQVRYNPDLLTEHKLMDSEAQLAEDMKDLELLGVEIHRRLEHLITDVCSFRQPIVDGECLRDVLHSRGINVRYLGTLAGMCEGKLEEVASLKYLRELVVREMVVRGAKRILADCMRNVGASKARRHEHWFLAPVVTAFLNSFLGPHCGGEGLTQDQLHAATTLLERGAVSADRANRTSGKKKKDKNVVRLEDGSRAPDSPIAPANLWQSIRRTVSRKFKYELPAQWSVTRDTKLCLLRSVCKATGITVASREYSLTESKEPIFTMEDVLDVVSRPKLVALPCKAGLHALDKARIDLRLGRLEEAHRTAVAALERFEHTFGLMQKCVADAHNMLAQIFLTANEATLAIEHQQKALIITQRVMGLDHYETARQHSTMAHILNVCGLSAVAAPHAERALYLFELLCGSEHPSSAAAHFDLAVVLQNASRVKAALRLFQEAANRYERVLGPKHHFTATSLHALALASSLLGDYRSAVQHEKAAKAIWTDLFGSENAWTRQAAVRLAQFARGAVMIERGEVTRSIPVTAVWIHPAQGVYVDMLELQLSLLEARTRAIEDHERALQHQQELDDFKARLQTTFDEEMTLDNLEIHQPRLPKSAQDSGILQGLGLNIESPQQAAVDQGGVDSTPYMEAESLRAASKEWMHTNGHSDHSAMNGHSSASAQPAQSAAAPGATARPVSKAKKRRQKKKAAKAKAAAEAALAQQQQAGQTKPQTAAAAAQVKASA